MIIERIEYVINWKAFKRGTSFFVPCLDPRPAKEEILRATKWLRMRVLTKVTIEDGVQGVRVWRL